MKEPRKDVFGYFDDPFSDKCAYDPMDSGIQICAVCAKPISEPLKTISLMKENDIKSYFYRAHKGCYEALSEKDITDLDSSLIDNL